MKIGIAGAGGIGGNVAVHLVRSGVDHIKIVDFDKVEKSNLNRQFYFEDQIGMPKVEAIAVNLKRIRPDLDLIVENKFLTPENIEKTFQDCDIVVEGFDKADCKAMILEAFLNTDKFIVSASGVAGLRTDTIESKKFGKNAVIIGDFSSDIKDFKLYSPKVFIVASLMANEILRNLDFSE